MSLEYYIGESFESGLSYNDASQLCLRLFCTVDEIPVQYHEECNKHNLSVIFSNLSKKGLITPNYEQAKLYSVEQYPIKDISHWFEVIGSIFKIGGTVHPVAGKKLIYHLTRP